MPPFRSRGGASLFRFGYCKLFYRDFKSGGQGGILLIEGGMLLAYCASFSAGQPGGELPPITESFSLALLLVMALWAWWRALARAKMLDGTPIERIASTAQGYAGLTGLGYPLEGRRARLSEPETGQPCLWYRAVFSDGDRIEDEETDVSFVLDDGSGAVCVVDPEGAEMLAPCRRHWRSQVTVWSLRPGDRIYALGEFVTLGSITPDTDLRRQTGELLELWKADRPELLRRFDLDRDGQLSLPEWDLARAAARREVLHQQQQAQAAPEAHILRKPRDGRPYLIANRDPRVLARHLRLWAIVHAAIFTAAAVVLARLCASGGSGGI